MFGHYFLQHDSLDRLKKSQYLSLKSSRWKGAFATFIKMISSIFKTKSWFYVHYNVFYKNLYQFVFFIKNIYSSKYSVRYDIIAPLNLWWCSSSFSTTFVILIILLSSIRDSAWNYCRLIYCVPVWL